MSDLIKLQSVLGKLQAEEADLAGQLKLTREKITQIENAISVFKEYLQPENRFSDMGVNDVLRQIARENSNILDTFQVRKALAECQFYTDERTAAKNIYPRLATMPEFVKTDKQGIYRLVGPKAKAPLDDLEPQEELKSDIPKTQEASNFDETQTTNW